VATLLQEPDHGSLTRWRVEAGGAELAGSGAIRADLELRKSGMSVTEEYLHLLVFSPYHSWIALQNSGTPES
jgi:hypothetical protein